MNVPPTIARAVWSGHATMAELSTALGLEDLYDILEVAAVESHNRRLWERWQRQHEGAR